VPYSKIPGFSVSSVVGHSSELVFGSLNGTPAVCMRGRFHYYEGNDMAQVVFPIRVCRRLGCKLIVVTNAAGGLNPNFNVGDIVCVQDHYGGSAMIGINPLRGPNDDTIGPRFPPMSDCYDSKLQDLVMKASKELGYQNSVRPNGTYCMTGGPSYEMMAESRFLSKVIGGDCVGMSTVPDVIGAKHCGMAILCLSLITNQVVQSRGKDTIHATHEEVIAAAKESGIRMQRIVEKVVSRDEIGTFLDALPPAPTFTPPPVKGSFQKAIVWSGLLYVIAMASTAAFRG
jgi:purine-nucleoside phosphorylase